MIKVKCEKDEIVAYPTTGIITPGGVTLPLVAPVLSGDKYEMVEGDTVELDAGKMPAVGGNGGIFTVTNNHDYDITLVRWFEVNNDPTVIDEEQSYIDLDGNPTTDNAMMMTLPSNESYTDKTIRSNAITVTLIGLKPTQQPA